MLIKPSLRSKKRIVSHKRMIKSLVLGMLVSLSITQDNHIVKAVAYPGHSMIQPRTNWTVSSPKTIDLTRNVYSPSQDKSSFDRRQPLNSWRGSLKLTSSTRATTPALRDKNLAPFASDSIWNMPLGRNAVYRDADLQPARYTGSEVDYYFVTTEKDPIVPWYNPGNWGVGRNTGKVLNGYLRVPRTLIVPDATPVETPNNAVAFLQPDGQTLVQMTALTRTKIGGPIYGYTTPGYPKTFENIYGSGITGGHGGSGLSSIGGTIRRGELLPSSANIKHALKINVQASRYLYNKAPGYRWPAIRADAYAFNPNSSARYGGSNSALVMGSLLAIPPAITAASLSLKTQPARKLLYALKYYGAYIADDTAWESFAIATEKGVDQEFEQAYGYSFGAYAGDFHDDINRLFGALQVVDNNGPQSIGGDGRRRRALAPAIGN
jgi:hypothetical protein